MIHVCTMNMYVHILYNYVSVCVGMCVFFVIQLERERDVFELSQCVYHFIVHVGHMHFFPFNTSCLRLS